MLEDYDLIRYKVHKPIIKQGEKMKKILMIMTIIMSTALMAQIRLSVDMAGKNVHTVTDVTGA